MSGASQTHDDRHPRLLRSEEKDLIKKALGPSIDMNLDRMKVFDANDGGMGGVRIDVDRSPTRVFGSEVARLAYIDADGVPVSITLNLDKSGNLFEIDFWKVDFSPLVAYPKVDQLKRGDP